MYSLACVMVGKELKVDTSNEGRREEKVKVNTWGDERKRRMYSLAHYDGRERGEGG